ncbi:PREDICTED: uncharacterized protein LOC109584306 isoform X2 [Amphimedon queenslandica]|uniref:Uncharacterized protein n=1 Tax=Amphimedon queenslandica TaxID=400682 RepID=A0A1X7VTA4_AMPQE|nr:PREDICTED: uncharacterized protein LOC109584306 isoform X2 [Amphimedon queenslandica]|eukprot:XP_019855561.1 PREDICTED: uncharacterized protein LOC109584306 isoform X2 [Amphimedon queenslandica]
MNCTMDDCLEQPIIIFSILLSISYILILILFIISCYMCYQRKQGTKYQRLRETRKGELFPIAQESTAEANASKHDTSMAEDSTDPQNGKTPAPKRGVDVSMDNPNYMSNSTIRVHQEKDTKRVSVISESNQRNENPNRRVSKLDPRASYSGLDHPIIVVEEVSKNEEEEDVYSLANESEHNYSCISHDSSQNSRDDRQDRDSVHDYSCISNNSRLSTSSSNSAINNPDEGRPTDIEPADYEDFYSIPNADGNISESEGENETEGNKGGHEKEGKEEKRQEEQSVVNSQPNPDCQSRSDVKQTSVEATDKTSKIKRRSATSSDIFNVQSTESSLVAHASDSKLTRLPGIEGRSSSSVAAPGTPYKPVPKPRMLRKAAESTTK